MTGIKCKSGYRINVPLKGKQLVLCFLYSYLLIISLITETGIISSDVGCCALQIHMAAHPLFHRWERWVLVRLGDWEAPHWVGQNKETCFLKALPA